VRPELTVQIETDLPTPELGYPSARKLLARNEHFTALFAYNDISAIGAIQAFQEAGLRVPEDVSVVGFDDIPLAVIFKPELTTVCQPLHRMGRIAAKTIIQQIEKAAAYQPEIMVEPELIQRASSGRIKNGATAAK
jgi:DNA-binding LacI/PurR family transcriptional regulator